MVRRVFFSYHFERDAWRANQVRNCWVPEPNREAAGFFDAADQEEVKRSSDEEIKRWIDSQLHGTSVTVILIGEETSERNYVKYEIEKSFERGNALLGIHIHNLKNKKGQLGYEGANPLSDYLVEMSAGKKLLSTIYPTYDWLHDGGQENMADWIEEAKEADRRVSHSARENLEQEEIGLLDVVITGAVVIGGIKVASEIVDEVARNFR